MSSLVETYALQCGVKIGKPYITKHFFPLPFAHEKTILFHTGGGNNNFPAKIYDYFDDVVKLITPIVNKHGYKIVQIGGEGEPYVGSDALNLCGRTTIHQTAFLIQNCALFVGNDSMNAHVAGAFGKPMVVPYGPTDIKNHGPFWRNAEKTILLESHRFGNKHPSYASNEKEKTINLIPIETVANSILKLLSLPIIERQSIFVGEIFKSQILELVPTTLIDPNFMPNGGINVRMDFHHDEQMLDRILETRKCAIFLSKPVDLDVFRRNLNNVSAIKVKITDDITPEYAKSIIKLGVKTAFGSDSDDEKWLKSKRLMFMDKNILIEKQKSFTYEDFLKKSEKYLNKKLDESFKIEEYCYKSTKFTIDKSGIYTSKAAYLHKKSINNFSENELVIGDLSSAKEFWNEIEHFYIYKK